ncbi:MAG TPA: hypothetical protein VG815_10725 [Chloroflexota bacterium]|nr:hypothetical protein [Chloroflexota bacterium]
MKVFYRLCPLSRGARGRLAGALLGRSVLVAAELADVIGGQSTDGLHGTDQGCQRVNRQRPDGDGVAAIIKLDLFCAGVCRESS